MGLLQPRREKAQAMLLAGLSAPLTFTTQPCCKCDFLSLRCARATKSSFHLFLKECEFRFNYATPEQQPAILKNGISNSLIQCRP